MIGVLRRNIILFALSEMPDSLFPIIIKLYICVSIILCVYSHSNDPDI